VASANRRVAAEIERWAGRYRRGRVPARLVRPALADGERLAVTIFPVRLSEEPAGLPFDQWAPRPGSRSLRIPFRNDGRLYATNQRLRLVRHPRRGVHEVHREWTWSEVTTTEVLPNWRGVSLRVRHQEETVVVVANVFHTFLVRPNTISLAANWVKVVGSWADSQGRFDAWLPATVDRIIAGEKG
jgi:hypothetical protein